MIGEQFEIGSPISNCFENHMSAVLWMKCFL